MNEVMSVRYLGQDYPFEPFAIDRINSGLFPCLGAIGEKNMKNPYLLIHQKRYVYLVNASDRTINRFIYSTSAMKTYDDQVVISSIPQYCIENIPAKSHCCIEEIDPYEDGVVSYRADLIAWDDGSEEKDVDLNVRKLWGGGSVEGEEVELDKTLLSTREGKVLDLTGGPSV
jgi:hypothetical protein